MNMAIWEENGIQIQKEVLLRGNTYSTITEGLGEKSSQENGKNLEITIFPQAKVLRTERKGGPSPWCDLEGLPAQNTSPATMCDIPNHVIIHFKVSDKTERHYL